MKPGATIYEIAHIFKEIQERPGQWFEMIRPDIKEVVGKYLTAMKQPSNKGFSFGYPGPVRISGSADRPASYRPSGY
jgi:putative transposase